LVTSLAHPDFSLYLFTLINGQAKPVRLIGVYVVMVKECL
jgi:hypothetical protein